MTKEFGRRDFLKMAGVTSLAGAGAFAASSALPKKAKAEYMQPASFGVNMSIKYLDTPGYNLPPYADGDKLERYDSWKKASSNPGLNEKFFGGKSFMQIVPQTIMKHAKGDDAGYHLKDIALHNGAIASKELPVFMDWKSDAQFPMAKMLGGYNDTPENNSKYIKKAGYFFGAGAVGTTVFNEKWLYKTVPEKGKNIPVKYSSEFSVPRQTETEWQIPSSMKYAVVFIMPMEGVAGKYAPTMIAGAACQVAYSGVAEVAVKIADFIRNLGYHAIPACDGVALSVPMAIDAGLGELSRIGLLISPEFGSYLRIGKVITDLPLAQDKAISFGAAEFCKTCKKCAETCPSKSLSFEEEPSYEVACESNNPGMKRWYANTWTCLNYIATQAATGCFACIRSCTYSKPHTWVHDVVKVVTSKTTLFNSIFVKMDDAFGYGDVFCNGNTTAEELESWWDSTDTRNFNWNRMEL